MDQNAYNTNPPPNNAPDNELPTYQELAAQHGPNSRHAGIIAYLLCSDLIS